MRGAGFFAAAGETTVCFATELMRQTAVGSARTVVGAGARPQPAENRMQSLAGQLLVAMPQMTDPRFARSVVYLCAHSEEAGAMGLVINKLLASLTMEIDQPIVVRQKGRCEGSLS